MKIICGQKELLKGIHIASKAVTPKSSDPNMECIVIDTKNNDIRLVANNMELGIETIISGEIIENNSVDRIELTANLFQNIIKSLPDTNITIEYNSGSKATISDSSDRKFEINVTSADEFPFPTKLNKSNPIEISQLALKTAIGQTSFAASKNGNGDMMTGESFKIIAPSTLRLSALNGHRIAIRNVNLDKEYENSSIIIPAKSMDDIASILSTDDDKKVSVYIGANSAMFEFDDTTIISRLIEGKYFNVEQMLSDDYETHIVVDKQSIASCIQRTKLVVSDSEKRPVILNVTDGNVLITMNGSKGKFEENLEIEKNGKDIEIGFNPDYLISTFNAITDEKVDMYFINSKAPCFIKDANEVYIYLILPININVN